MPKSLIKKLRIGLASPEVIEEWSSGEVKKPETFNYRTYKPEKEGLFCEVIFGPTKDFECACGKYKKVRYKNTRCDRCGVLITKSSVRRENSGHIKLACPVAHIWFTKSIPNRFSALLGISAKEIEKIIYYVNFVVFHVNEDWLKENLPEIELAVAEQINLLNAQKIELRDIRELDMFELLSACDGISDEERSAAEKLSKTFVKPGGKVISDEKYASDVALLKESVVRTSVLDDFMLAHNVVDPVSFEVVAEAWAKFTFPTVSKLVDLGIFKVPAENIKTREENKNLITEIERQIKSLSRGMDVLRTVKYMNRLSDQDFDNFEYLKYVVQREMGVDLGDFIQMGMGAGALREILRKLDLRKLEYELGEELEKIKHRRTSQKRKKLVKRLKTVRAFLKSENRPEWMILSVLPVLPPELRPMVELEGGRFASSDLNDLYRRVINRNNRLKKLIDIKAPESILRNEKRMLQEAVDSLIDNGRKGRAAVNTNNRALKSLSDMLKGKQGRFRQNLLGKRVDYSGRSVIVVGPRLKLHQCGIPKYMALELFKPFVLNRLINPDDPHQNISAARRMLEKAEDPLVWDKLEEIIQNHPVLLNRAPTLHRLSIQAFEPVLIEGKAIQLHPLACEAYNADFDGDQMAVHVPLSTTAQAEARILMLSANNVLLPADGKPVISPTKDLVLGMYYLTQSFGAPDDPNKVPIYSGSDEAMIAYENGYLKLQDWLRIPMNRVVLEYVDTPNADPQDAKRDTRRVQYYDERKESPPSVREFTEAVHCKNRWILTTAGRVLVNREIRRIEEQSDMTPEEGLPYVNIILDKNSLSDLIRDSYRLCGAEFTVVLADLIKDLGFEMATQAGITIGITDICIPSEKKKIISKANKEADKVWSKYNKKLVTQQEKDEVIIAIWDQATKDLTKAMRLNFGKFNSIFMMAESGARGKIDQVRQLAAMRGLIVGPTGNILPLPIQSNFREGLSVFEYFISTHGGRKGLVDTALKTADSGYLTRRLVDVALDVSIREYDCGSREGIYVELEDLKPPEIARKIIGRVLAEDFRDTETGELLFERDCEIDYKMALLISQVAPPRLKVRSVLTCHSTDGICAKCYGWDLSANRLAEIGDPVGVIAAQSIGEPGTQLTMRTFHIGGVTEEDYDVVRVRKLKDGTETDFNIRTSKDNSLTVKVGTRLSTASHYFDARHEVVTDEDGVVTGIDHKSDEVTIKTISGVEKAFAVPRGNVIIVKVGDKVSSHDNYFDRLKKHRADFDCEIIGIRDVHKMAKKAGAKKLGDITQGLPFVETMFEVRNVKNPELLCEAPGEVTDIERVTPYKVSLRGVEGMQEKNYEIMVSEKNPLVVKYRSTLKKGDSFDKNGEFKAEFAGTVGQLFPEEKKSFHRISVLQEDGETVVYETRHEARLLLVDVGDKVETASPLCDGEFDVRKYHELKGDLATQVYLVRAIQDIYESQNVSPNSKHIEIIASQMIKYVQVENVMDAENIYEGDLIEKKRFNALCAELEKDGKNPPTGKSLLQGISKASLSTGSFLAAASFQETTRVLTEASIEGKVDLLEGLKENVIIGGLIPVGTGVAKEPTDTANPDEFDEVLGDEDEDAGMTDELLSDGGTDV
ncbi:DNA-directed RNA polymerase subunit beta' [bacterium]|nr:DNA-directed RNA polymerase subunit beta' [bacterium]